MIVCVGTTPVWQRSMVFGRLTLDGVNRAAEVHDYASGKSVNVARVLHTLGEEVVAVGFAGGDRGAALLHDLDAAGISHEFVTVAAPTRQCVTVIDRAGGTATELVEESHPVADGDWRALDDVVARLVAGADGLVLSGSLPPGSLQDFYARCIEHVSASRPTRVVLDTRGEPFRQAMRLRGFVGKMNREELATTVGRATGTDDELVDATRGLMPVGGAAVVTLGADGAIAVHGRDAWRVRVPDVQARSAVGSGDAFAAGLVLGLVRGQPLPESCALGAACGAANAMTDLAGHLALEDVETLRKRVRVVPI